MSYRSSEPPFPTTPKSRFARAGFPPRAREAAHELLPRDEAPKGPAGRSWWDVYDVLRNCVGTGMLCALVGNYGAGKTVLACCIGWLACKRGLSVSYITAPALFRDLTSTFDDGARATEREVMGYYFDRGLLVIDEAHVRSNRQYDDQRLSEIIDVRYGHGRDTLLVSNLGPAEFAGAVGLAVVDRMNQCGGIIRCDWPSFRRQPGEKLAATLS